MGACKTPNMAAEAGSHRWQNEGASNRYTYPKVTGPLRALAWIQVSSFSIALLLLPLASAIILLRTVLQLLGLAAWQAHWLYASLCVLVLAAAPHRKWPWMSEQWQKAFALWNRLFETTVILPAGCRPEPPFILTVHPHGIIPITGCLIWEATRRFNFAAPDYFGGASAALRIPLFRQFLIHNGGVPAGRHECSKVLEKGCSYSVFTGGVTEMVLSKNSAEVLYVKKRRGVFDLAKKLGNIPIIPVWAFGTTKHFSRWPDENESVLTRISRKFKASILIPIGWLGLPIPNWHPVTLVFGQSIDTSGDVDVAHQKWVEWYRVTYYEHRDAAGYSDRELELM